MKVIMLLVGSFATVITVGVPIAVASSERSSGDGVTVVGKANIPPPQPAVVSQSIFLPNGDEFTAPAGCEMIVLRNPESGTYSVVVVPPQ